MDIQFEEDAAPSSALPLAVVAPAPSYAIGGGGFFPSMAPAMSPGISTEALPEGVQN